MPVAVVPYSPEWPRRFERVADDLARALAGVPVVSIEHVGSTSVPGLDAKPIIDVDVIVRREHRDAALRAVEAAGYERLGDLGLADREALRAPDDLPRRNVYVCVAGTLHVRNHLAVREVLRARPDLRERYAAVKRGLAADPTMDIGRYTAGKSAVLREVLGGSDLTAEEKALIQRLNEAD